VFARLNLATVAPGVAVDAISIIISTGAVAYIPSKLKERIL
jgi:hypothetical protein